MAFIKASDLKALLAQVEDSAILQFDINNESGKIEVGVIDANDLQSCSSCETCETPCSDKKEI